jgi:hypothetical protein
VKALGRTPQETPGGRSLAFNVILDISPFSRLHERNSFQVSRFLNFGSVSYKHPESCEWLRPHFSVPTL